MRDAITHPSAMTQLAAALVYLVIFVAVLIVLDRRSSE